MCNKMQRLKRLCESVDRRHFFFYLQLYLFRKGPLEAPRLLKYLSFVRDMAYCIGNQHGGIFTIPFVISEKISFTMAEAS